jgi:Aldehyde oxidase and xanthine dehydrogenase, a/b hammerhead domain
MQGDSGNGCVVGASLLRKEDARHLHGRGQFVADVKLPNTRNVAFVRSPHAHARIKDIVVPPDAAGRVFAARDLPRLTELRAVPQVSGFRVSGYPPLAKEKVRYVGEPIATCIAPTRAEAEDLAAAVIFEFEVLPEGRPQLRPCGSLVPGRRQFGAQLRILHLRAVPGVAGRRHLSLRAEHVRAGQPVRRRQVVALTPLERDPEKWMPVSEKIMLQQKARAG